MSINDFVKISGQGPHTNEATSTSSTLVYNDFIEQ